ncbi:MAG: hypothetical protein NTY63_04775 [Candidatus Bipolaricaulota bacterium]|nr:hypothetical protein [Candidatus Bipolaricaulota bacterium]
MKRLAIGLLLTSLLLGAGLTVAASPLFEDPNVVWSTTLDGTAGYLLLVNTGSDTFNTIILVASTPIALVDVECYIYSGGQIVVSGLDNYLGQMADTYFRINLPQSVGFMDYVVLKITSSNDQAIKLYQATFKNY